jgi:hypothetical protein
MFDITIIWDLDWKFSNCKKFEINNTLEDDSFSTIMEINMLKGAWTSESNINKALNCSDIIIYYE